MKRLCKTPQLLALWFCVGFLASALLAPGAAKAAQMQAGLASLTVNQTVVGFGGHEWWVVGVGNTGLPAKDDSHATLLLKGWDAGGGFGASPFREGKNTDPGDGSMSMYTDGWYYAGSFMQPNEYAGSTLFHRMEEIASQLQTTSPKEYQMITARTIGTEGITGPAVGDQRLWPLSASEYATLTDIPIREFDSMWWLRSPETRQTRGLLGNMYGMPKTPPSLVRVNNAVRPALYLNLQSVLFTSSVTDGKSASAVGGGLAAVTAPTGAVKFTVKDAGQTLEVTATQAQSVQTGNTLHFSYRNATTGAKQYVCCILRQAGKLTHYGRIAACDRADAASGSLSIPLAGVADGSYTLELFSEQGNGGLFTDFASEPVRMQVTVAGGQGTVSGFGGTLLSNDAGLLRVAGQAVTPGGEAGTAAHPKTAHVWVDSGIATLRAADLTPAHAQARAELFADANYSQNRDAGLPLVQGGATHAYIRVTAEDGTASLYYDVTVHREAAPRYRVTASAGKHGRITPAGEVMVAQGGNQTFVFTPDSGYVVDAVLLDGVAVAHAGGSYTLERVTGNHTLQVTFVRGIVVPANEADARKKEPRPEGGQEPQQHLPSLWTAAGNLNVRSGPGTDYEKLGSLKAGQAVQVLAFEDGWAKIQYAGGADGCAYVSAQYLTPTLDATGVAWVHARTLNVRSGAGTDFAIVGKLRRGAQVEILDTVADGAWYKIRYGSGAAYVSAKYVSR